PAAWPPSSRRTAAAWTPSSRFSRCSASTSRTATSRRTAPASPLSSGRPAAAGRRDGGRSGGAGGPGALAERLAPPRLPPHPRRFVQLRPPPAAGGVADHDRAHPGRLPPRRRTRPPRHRRDLGAGAPRPRTLGPLPQRRHPGPELGVRPRRRRRRLPRGAAATTTPPGRLLPHAHGRGAGPRAALASALRARLRGVLRPVRPLLRPAAPPQGGGRRRLAHQHVGLRHLDTARRLGPHRPAPRAVGPPRHGRLLPAVRRVLPAHPALPVRGGPPPRRPHPRPRARHAPLAPGGRRRHRRRLPPLLPRCHPAPRRPAAGPAPDPARRVA